MTYLPNLHHVKLPTALWAAASANNEGRLNVQQLPTTMFYETFAAGALDTVDKWTITGTAPTMSASTGLMTMPTTGTSIITSKAAMNAVSNAHMLVSSLWAVEATPATGQGRFFGVGTVPTTPSTTSLAQEGVGFEHSSTGTLYAVIYTGGVRTIVATLTRPTDGGYHRYSLMWRASRSYWLIDGVEVATRANVNTAIQDLPVQVASFGTATAGASSTMLAVGVGDLGRNHAQLADGQFPWRRAKIEPNGDLHVTSSNRRRSFVGIATTGLLTGATAADAATAGRHWLVNNPASNVLVAIRRVEGVVYATGAASAAGRFTIERITTTTAATGAESPLGWRDNNETHNANVKWTAVSTGMTITAGAALYSFVAPVMITSGTYHTQPSEWEPDEEGMVVLRPGHGIVIRQAEGLTNNHRASFNIAWEEFTLPAATP